MSTTDSFSPTMRPSIEVDNAEFILPRETGEGNHAQHGGGGEQQSSKRSPSPARAAKPAQAAQACLRWAVPLPRCAGEDKGAWREPGRTRERAAP